MKYFLLLFSILLGHFLCCKAQSLVPQIEFVKSYGGNNFDGSMAGVEIASGFRLSYDGALLYSSCTNSTTHDLVCDTSHTNKGWLLKTDKQGNEIYSICYGGSLESDSASTSREYFYDMQATKDSGCIVCCYTTSANIPPSALFLYACDDSAHGYKVMALIKYDKNGNVQWSHCYGSGSDDDGIYSIDNTSDGGYIFLAQTRGIGGDINVHYGNVFNPNGWVVKIDSLGNIQWSKVLGGTNNNLPSKVKEISPGKYMTAMNTASTDSMLENVTLYSGSNGWFCTFDSAGNIIRSLAVPWYGNEVWPMDFTMTNDGGLIWVGMVTGDSQINTGCNAVSANSNQDFAIFKMDSSFQIQWCYITGGSGFDVFSSITKMTDSIFVICGTSESVDYAPSCLIDSTGLTGWMLYMDINGQLLGRKCMSGSMGASVSYSIVDSVTGSIYLEGVGESTDGDLTGVPNYGYRDQWLFKINMVNGINQVNGNNSIRIFPNPANEAFNIQISNELINYPYTIKDITGRNILSGNLNNEDTKVDVRNLSDGLYFLNIGDTNPKVFKIVKE